MSESVSLLPLPDEYDELCTGGEKLSGMFVFVGLVIVQCVVIVFLIVFNLLNFIEFVFQFSTAKYIFHVQLVLSFFFFCRSKCSKSVFMLFNIY